MDFPWKSIAIIRVTDCGFCFKEVWMVTVSEQLNTKKAAIYIRVSTKYQIDKDSLLVQRRELEAYADMVLGIKDYVIFEDAGYSAKNTDRPDYQRMMDRLRTGEFSHLLVWKIDRISRNLLDFAEMYSELKKLGIAFVSKNEQFDTSNAVGEAMLKIILVFAELERQMTSERVTAVMLSRANNGQWNGGRVPYGYDYDKKSKTFSIDPAESAIVKKIYLLYDQYNSLIYVCRSLNNIGLKTRAGNEWNVPSIYKILTNPFYTGAYLYNVHSDGRGAKKKDRDEWVTIENHHPSIISKQDFDKLALVLDKNKRGGVPEGKTYLRKNIHVFAGLVKCGVCGANMSSTLDREHADGWRPSVYGCSRRRGNSGACSNKFASDASFGGFVVNYIANIIRLRDHVTEKTSLEAVEKKLLRGLASYNVVSISRPGLEELRDMLAAGQSGLEYRPPIATSGQTVNEKAALEDQHRKKEAALARLRSLYLYSESGMSESEYVVERNQIVLELQGIEKRLSKIREEEPDSLISSEDFISRASYFVMVEHLLDDTAINYQKFSTSIDKSIQRSFFTSVISSIILTNGKVTSISFKNGITNHFIYK